jgi:hypothetical protein
LGQKIVIDGTRVTFYAANGAVYTGTYDPVTHQFNFGSGNVVALGSNGTAVVTATDATGRNLAAPIVDTSGGVTQLGGNLDILGSRLTLGGWQASNGDSIYGLVMNYTDATSGTPGLLGLSTTRSGVDWLWSHPSTDGGSDSISAMLLDYSHRVLLYDPANPGTANVVLDPGGASAFHGPVRVQPQGDIPMLQPASGPTPP